MDGGVCAADDTGARGHDGIDLAEPQLLLAVGAKLAFAWLVINLVTSVIRNTFVVRLVSISAWLVVALSTLGQLEPAIEALDSVSIVLGDLRLTPLLLIKLGALLIVALWLTNVPAISWKAGSPAPAI